MTGYDNKELTISLEKHYDKAIADLEKLMLSKFEAIREAILKSDKYAEYRDNKQNEFRKTLDDQNETFSRKTDLENLEKQFDIWMSGTRQVAEANFNVAMCDIRKLEKELGTLKDTREGSTAVWPWVITIISALIMVLTIIYNIVK